MRDKERVLSRIAKAERAGHKLTEASRMAQYGDMLASRGDYHAAHIKAVGAAEAAGSASRLLMQAWNDEREEDRESD